MNNGPRPFERYKWLLDGLREQVSDVEFYVSDYGYTVYLVSRSRRKQMPLMLGGFGEFEAWDYIDHFNISTDDRRAETIEQLAHALLSDSIRAPGSDRPS